MGGSGCKHQNFHKSLQMSSEWLIQISKELLSRWCVKFGHLPLAHRLVFSPACLVLAIRLLAPLTLLGNDVAEEILPKRVCRKGVAEEPERWCQGEMLPKRYHPGDAQRNLTGQSTRIMQLLLDMLISLRIVRMFAICEFSSSPWQKFPSETGFRKLSRCGICEERDNKKSPFFTRDNFASRI